MLKWLGFFLVFQSNKPWFVVVNWKNILSKYGELFGINGESYDGHVKSYVLYSEIFHKKMVEETFIL